MTVTKLAVTTRGPFLPPQADNDEWEEKWGERFEASGSVTRWADKWGKQGPQVWHERWGEDWNGRGSAEKWCDKVCEGC